MNALPYSLTPDLEPVLETALDAVVVMRQDGVVLAWNAVAEAIFGWSREQAVGAQLSELIIPARYREAHHKGLKNYLETGEGPLLNRRVEISALRASGEEFPVELSITPTAAASGQIFLGFLRDITERKSAEAMIRRRAAEAEAIAALTALAAESSSFELVMQHCLEAVCAITGWGIGHAFCCSEENPELLVESGLWHVSDGSEIGPLIQATEQTEFRAGVGLPGRALERQAPVWLADVEQDTNFPRVDVTAALQLHAAFAFPIRSGSRMIAVLEFFHKEPAEPDLSLWPTLQTLGEQVGRVFERTRAADSLQKERIALLAEIDRRKALEQHQQLLLKELNHRVKNMLAVVAGIAHQTGKGSATIEEFMPMFSGRLTALATAHTLLTRESWQSAPLGDLVHDLVVPFAGGGQAQIVADGPTITLQPRALLALSLIVHELLTNALKHGALGAPGGTIRIEWDCRDDPNGKRVILSWHEQGLHGLGQPERSGFGSRLLEASARHELRGTIVTNWNDDGLDLQIEFPLDVS